MKKNLLLMAVLSLCFVLSAFGQELHQIGEIPLGPWSEFFTLKVTMVPTANDSALVDTIDSGLGLSQDTISSWGDYSCYVRFRNDNKDPFIDARNGGGFAVTDSVFFTVGTRYYVWLEVDFLEMKYYVYVQEEGQPVETMIADAFLFRNTNITELAIYQTVTNPGNPAHWGVVVVEEIEYVDEVEPVTAIKPRAASRTADFTLIQNFPNPFNPETVISYQLPVSSRASVDVYDLSGRLVKRLFDGVQSSGTHEVIWDGTDQSGVPVSSGIYVYCLSTPGSIAQGKMMLVR